MQIIIFVVAQPHKIITSIFNIKGTNKQTSFLSFAVVTAFLHNPFKLILLDYSTYAARKAFFTFILLRHGQ